MEAGQDITPGKGKSASKTRWGDYIQAKYDAVYATHLRCMCDPGAEMDEEIRWIVERKPRDIDYIKERYGKDVSADENVGFVVADVTPQNGFNSTSKNDRTWQW